MRIAILTNGGIERLFEDQLGAMPIEERTEKLMLGHDRHKNKVTILPSYRTYNIRPNVEFNIMGPCSTVPIGYVAKSESETTRITDNLYPQQQLVVLTHAIFDRMVMRETVHTLGGICTRSDPMDELWKQYIRHWIKKRKVPRDYFCDLKIIYQHTAERDVITKALTGLKLTLCH
jgi:hypothetical protein